MDGLALPLGGQPLLWVKWVICGGQLIITEVVKTEGQLLPPTRTSPPEIPHIRGSQAVHAELFPPELFSPEVEYLC